MNDKKIEIDIADVYQLLISAGRYAYTRNNHLEPHCFYKQTENIIMNMFKVDEEYAMYTLKQLVEECINKELSNLTGEDTFGNKLATINFIEWGIGLVHLKGDVDWLPLGYYSTYKTTLK